MKPLCLFVGLLLGIAVGGASSWMKEGFFLFFSLILLLVGWRQKCLRFALPSLGVGITLGLLGRLDPILFSPRVGVVSRVSENYFLLKTFTGSFYVSARSHSYEVGDLLRIEGKYTPLKFMTFESRFDFASYLGTLGVKKELVPNRNGIHDILRTPFRIRSYSSYCLKGFDQDSSSLISGVLFNIKDSSSSLYQSLSSLNLLHLFSSSGFVASFFLRRAERIFWYKASEEQAKTATLVLSALLCFLSPYKVGLWRIFFSRLYTLINIKHGKIFRGFEITSFSGITLLVLNFRLAYQSAFWIGYGASLYSYFSNGFFLTDKKEDTILPKFVLFQVFFLPVLLSSGDHTLHLLSPIWTFLFLPFAIGYLFLGIMALLGCPLTSFAAWTSSALKSVSSFFLRYDAKFSLYPSWEGFVYLYYALIVLGSFVIQFGDRTQFKRMALLYLGAYLLSFVPIYPFLTQEVSFINVGQGDAILIRDGMTSVMLDTGGNISFDMAKESLIPYLRKKRIYKLDCLIASHGDFDHIGAKDSLMRNFSVGRFIEDPSDFPLTIGNLTFRNINVYPSKDENESSLVLALDFMGYSFLFTGDAPVSIEKQILEDNPGISCDILKVGHHGSDTSTCAEFLDALKPKEAVISVGYKNHYGHPKKEVVERLEERGIRIRRTDEEGTITYARRRPWKI